MDIESSACKIESCNEYGLFVCIEIHRNWILMISKYEFLEVAKIEEVKVKIHTWLSNNLPFSGKWIKGRCEMNIQGDYPAITLYIIFH